MIVDEPKNLKDYKVIIIGSGPAGLSLALTLEKKKINCLIIESGNEKSNVKNKYINQNPIYKNTPYKFPQQFGGASSIWGGNCNPLEENDFKNWPIKKNDIDKYLNSAKKILNLKNEFIKLSLTSELDIINLQWSNVKFQKKYLKKISKSKYIDIIFNSFFFNTTIVNNRVHKIHFIKNKKKYFINVNELVLACGGIQNSRMMLLIKKQNPSSFDNRMPIGNYYMDHPYYQIGNGFIFKEKLQTILKKNKFIIDCDRSINFSLSDKYLNKIKILDSKIQFKFIELKNTFSRQLACVAPNLYKEVFFKRKQVLQAKLFIIQEQESKYENKVFLSSNKNKNGFEEVSLDWNISEKLKESSNDIYNKISNYLIKNKVGRITRLINLNSKYTLGNHQIGGTRIGNHSYDSVVNKNLKVHNLENLYITGSSIFRSSGHAHPTLTIVQLSIRLADHISKNYETKK